MKNKNQKMRDEIAKEIFYGIPPDSERKKMSPEELAILLSECEKNSPKYFLVRCICTLLHSLKICLDLFQKESLKMLRHS